MTQAIYFDNNATTKIDESVLEAMLPYFKENYGNPSSIYYFGKSIKEEIVKAKKNIAKLLNAKANEIIFTSCASESNVTAIMNAVKLNPNKKHIITTSVEHASILETMKNVSIVEPLVTIKSALKEENMADLEALADAIVDAGV